MSGVDSSKLLFTRFIWRWLGVAPIVKLFYQFPANILCSAIFFVTFTFTELSDFTVNQLWKDFIYLSFKIMQFLSPPSVFLHRHATFHLSEQSHPFSSHVSSVCAAQLFDTSDLEKYKALLLPYVFYWDMLGKLKKKDFMPLLILWCRFSTSTL